MNALESPIEALAFNYLSYGVFTAVSNIWTVVALLTAAVSFWRMKIRSSDIGSAISESESILRICHSPSPPLRLYPSTETEEVAECSPSLTECSDGTTSGKFAVYYNVNVDDVSEGDDLEVDDVYGNSDGFGYGRECAWESILKLKTGDGGWYRYQDLTVLDGNVVRFWEECSSRQIKGILVW